MIQQISSVSVYVNDQNAALDFYVGKLGFEKRDDQPMGPGARWIEVAPPGAQTVLNIACKEYHESAGAQIGKFTSIVFRADDIQATYATLRDRGVDFTEPPTTQPWGTYATFQDPDGNSFVLVQAE